MSLLRLFVVCAVMLASNFGRNAARERERRFIIYPYGAIHKLNFGIAIPVALPSQQNMVSIVNLQFQYAQMTNITQIAGGLPPTLPLTSRRRRDYRRSEHTLAYTVIESLMDRYGFNGRSCLLRAICENAMHTFNHEDNGLYGHLMDVLLTPDFRDDEITDLENEYLEAKKAGDFGVDCLSLYADCPEGQGLLELISEIEEAEF